MSEVKFTKGPWVVDNGACVYCDDATGSIVAECQDFLYVYKGGKEESANAHLIAAAPDMYEEIAHDIKLLKREAQNYVLGSYELLAVNARIDKKQKLLAKARGETTGETK